MKQETILFLSIAALVLTGVTISQYQQEEQEKIQSLQQVYQGKFDNWKQNFHKEYSNQSEEMYRFAVFMDNENFIEHWNEDHQGENEVKLKENDFVDMTDEEFSLTHLGLDQQLDEFKLGMPSNEQLEKQSDQFYDTKLRETIFDDYDFRYLNTQGVRKQTCGDCWAQTTAQVTELAFFDNVRISVQDLINCDSTNNGCRGGDQGRGMKFVNKYGFVTENDEPYKGEQNSCNTKNKRYGIKPDDIDTFWDFNASSSYCTKIKEMMSEEGPLGISLYAENSKLWRFYSGGILDHDLNESWRYYDQAQTRFSVNHAVVLMGFTDEYWLVLNSWGSQWGEQGYIRIKMGDYFNICHEAAGYVSDNLRFKKKEPSSSKGPFSGSNKEVREQFQSSTGHPTWVVLSEEKNYSTTYNTAVDKQITQNGSQYAIPLSYNDNYPSQQVKDKFVEQVEYLSNSKMSCFSSDSSNAQKVRDQLEQTFPNNYIHHWYNNGFSSSCRGYAKYHISCAINDSDYYFCLT